MVLTLDWKKDPFALEIVPGIVFTVRPQSLPMTEAAAAFARRTLEEAEKDPGVLKRLGWDMALPPLIEDDHDRQGLYMALSMTRVAQLAITDWEGVMGPDGTPMPCTAGNIATVMGFLPDVAALFWYKYTGVLEALEKAKNAWRPSPNGTSDEGPDTAGDAGTPAPPAPIPGDAAEELARIAPTPPNGSRKRKPRTSS